MRTGPWKLAETRWAALALILFLLGLALQLSDAPTLAQWTLYLACYVTGGWEPCLAGLRALREKTLDVDLLMIVAAVAAAALGQVFDGALLIVIFATSGALEAIATARTEDAVRGLLDLAPETATLLDDDGGERRTSAADLRAGDLVLVRPGERIPADGIVTAGGSDVDQATITGEPLAVPKNVGDDVFAGTLNGTGTLRVGVERPAAESVVARIAALVEQASATKARTQLFIEKVEQRYSVGMVVVTLAVFAVPLAFGEPMREALLRAMTFMIVASPCAVVLATMPPLLAAVANAGRHGVLVKSAVVMERLGSVSAVAFDKTGTLTRGTPEVVAVRIVAGADDRGTAAEEILALAAAVEGPSEHPLGVAIADAARRRGLPVPGVDDFRATPGRGVSGTVGGRVVEVLSPNAVRATAASAAVRGGPGFAAEVEAAESRGHTAVVVLSDGTPVGVIALADRVRDEAADAVRALGLETPPMLLTGDNAPAARAVGAAVGINDIRAGMLPDEKVDAISHRRAEGECVAMIGDGVNDAPALAAADVGIAMGRGASDLTLQTADVVVLRDDLRAVPAVLALARRARRVVAANLVIAGTFIGVLVVWDLVGTLPLPLGVAGHEGSTVLVGLNGLRLLRSSAWRSESR